jgi:hypothetical protein
MSHFAQVEDGIVKQVIVAEQDFIDLGVLPGTWIQTSYNTHAGQHPEGRPLRKNYAGIGYVYDEVRDAFYAPQPYPSWTLDEQTCIWQPPVAYPSDGNKYSWDESSVSWVLIS